MGGETKKNKHKDGSYWKLLESIWYTNMALFASNLRSPVPNSIYLGFGTMFDQMPGEK